MRGSAWPTPLERNKRVHIRLYDETGLETKDLTPREILEQAHTHLLPADAWVADSWFEWDMLPVAQGSHQACSVGAMLLVNTLNADDLQYMEDIADDAMWTAYLDSDPNFRIALQYLGLAIHNHYAAWFRDVLQSKLRLAWTTAEPWLLLQAMPGNALIALITTWNDVEDRTHDEVLSLFEAAIKLAVAGEERSHV